MATASGKLCCGTWIMKQDSPKQKGGEEEARLASCCLLKVINWVRMALWLKVSQEAQGSNLPTVIHSQGVFHKAATFSAPASSANRGYYNNSLHTISVVRIKEITHNEMLFSSQEASRKCERATATYYYYWGLRMKLHQNRWELFPKWFEMDCVGSLSVTSHVSNHFKLCPWSSLPFKESPKLLGALT